MGCKINLLLFYVILAVGCNSAKLGNGIYLLEGDRVEDRIIVKCSGWSYKECISGSYLIPRSYNNHFDSNGHYLEYVEKAASNKKWIITKTFQIKEKKENYWIIDKGFNIGNIDCLKINCDSIIQSHIKGPLSLADFNTIKKTLNIKLDF